MPHNDQMTLSIMTKYLNTKMVEMRVSECCGGDLIKVLICLQCYQLQSAGERESAVLQCCSV